MRAVLREKFIAINGYIKTEERSQIGNLTFFPKKLEKQSKLNLKQAEEKK